ncbi:MAG: hypothetical protein VW397_07840, partial [Candidatus Margulisiibacteriota bacterium]
VNMSVLNLERDFGLKNKRYLLGQISPMTKGSQATLSLLGVGITQGPILNSIGNFSPRFSHELILDVDSQVDIYINYQKVKSVNLPGGIYELKGFPLRTGFNVIKIVKTSVYDIVPSTKDDLVTDGVYNDINEGVLYKTKANQNESFLDQSLRLHNARIVSSEWLASDKVPRKGVQIEDDSPPVKKKVVTEFVYPFALDPVLYAPKYNELSYGIGFPATWSGLNLATSDQVTQSLYYKKGLNNFITSTVYTQVNNQHLLLGNELYIASPFGPISVNNALKQTQGIDKLGAFSRFSFLTYPIASDPNAPFRLLTIGFSGSLRASRFIPFGVARPVPYDNFLSQFSMGFSYQIRDLFSGTIQWSQTKALNGNSEGDVRQFSSVIQRRLPFNFNLSAAYQTNEGKLVVEPHLFTFKVGWSGFDGVNASSMYKETVGTKDVQVDATIQKTFLDGALTTSTYLQNSSEKKSLSTSLKYGRHNANFSFVETPLQTDQQLNYILTNQRFNSNIGVLHREVQGAPVNIFSLSAESAFVYADNYFAISTPIQDSFAVFASDYTLKGEPVFVGEEGRNINFLGPTVLPSLRDRVLTDIMVDIPNLPVGAEYQRLHSFQPVNVQGYLVELHVTPSVLLMGKLVNQKGRPYKYQRGYLVSKVTQKKQRFITSRSGIFQVPNLIPGTYQITFSKNRYTSVDITVPDNADGLFRLNNLVIQRNLDVELDSDNESELQQQLNEKQTQRQDEQLDDRSSEALLQQLIADILSEPILEIESVAPTQSLTKKETPVNDTPEMPAALINDPNLSSIENAQKLHALKGEINQLLLKAKSAPSEKDTLEIAQKINEFYLQLIQPDRSKLIQNINEITNTDQKAKAEHEKRKTREAFPSQRVRSDAIDEAQRQHLKRAKD